MLSGVRYVAARAVRTAVRTGVRTGADLAGELSGLRPVRRCWSGNGRAWVEVRGIDGPGGAELGRTVLTEVRALPGVRWAELNRPLSRLVVAFSGDVDGRADSDTAPLLSLIERVERSAAGATRATPGDLPGDAVVLAGRVLAAGADAAALAVAAGGRLVRWPRLPGSAAAAVALIDAQPRLRHALETRIGPDATDVLLAVSTAGAQALTQGPASLAVDLALRTVLVAEARAARQSWQRHEPDLAAAAACEAAPDAGERPVRLPPGRTQRYADIAAGGGLAAAGLLGALGRWRSAGDAVLVAVPKALRATQESYAATLAGGLMSDHDALLLRPAALRLLDRVDALVVDPRALTGSALRVLEVSGVDNGIRTAVWQAAQRDITDGLLGAGRHDVAALSPAHRLPPDCGARVLVGPARDPLAEATMAAARAAGLTMVSLDDPTLGALRSGFDDLVEVDGGSGAALARVVRDLQRDGRVVAALVAGGACSDHFDGDDRDHLDGDDRIDRVGGALEAAAAADLAIGLRRGGAPVWTGDVMFGDLAGVWRLLAAVPAARQVATRSVELAAGGSVLGALLMLPGVRGRGPGPVAAGAAFGVLEGRAAARRVLRRAAPRPVPDTLWHALNVEQALDEARGLPAPPPETDAALAGRSVGLARSVVRRAQDLIVIFRMELNDPLTPVLAIGAAASAVLGSPVDALLVTAVLTGNAALSAFQRVRAERQLTRLLAAQQTPARVVESSDHDGAQLYREVTPARLHPGQVIEIRGGEVVPADGRIIAGAGAEIDESALTGESLPVLKSLDPTPGAPLAERSCMVFDGTTVLTGTVRALVTAVGATTAAGRADALAPAAPDDVGLQGQLGRLTTRVLPVTLTAGAAVTVTGLLRGSGLRQAVGSGVSIAVAAVPEGLPLVATLAQQAAARRLARLGVLVRDPRSVEALGRVDVVCFDKTGTLSQNRLTVTRLQPASGADDRRLLTAAALASPRPVPGAALSHATDAAVVEAALEGTGGVPDRDRELPFRPGRAYAAGLDGTLLSVKGAPELVLGACTWPLPDGTERASVLAQVRELAGDGLRVLAVAERVVSVAEAADAARDDAALEGLCGGQLRFLGLLGLSDPPRPDAAAVLADLARRRIGARLITGDHPVTAAAIARQLGMPLTEQRVMTGPQWEALPQRGRTRAVDEVTVFARMSPEHKVQVVRELHRAGHVVAMVGDGANDAAAIRAAAVGLGVSTHGSDPARGAADVVLTEGRIGTLLQALDEGQELWRRVQSAITVLLGGNAGEVAFTLLGTAVGGRAPLNARQLLLVNMLTDALPAAAVAVSPAVVDGTGGLARGLDEHRLRNAVLIRGATTAAGATAAWTLGRLTGRQRRASTIGLVALVSTQLGQTLLDSHSPLVVGTALGSLAVLAVLVNTPGLSQTLGCTPLGPVGWAQALTCAGTATAVAGVAPRVGRWAGTASRTVTSPRAGNDLGEAGADQHLVQRPHRRLDQHGKQLQRAMDGHVLER